MLDVVTRKSRAITSVKATESSLYLSSEYCTIRLTPVLDHIIRVSVQKDADLVDDVTVGISLDSQACVWRYEESELDVWLFTKAIHMSVSLKSGSITYYDSKGQLLLKERDFESHELDSYDLYKTIDDGTAAVEQIVTADGVKSKIKAANQVFDQSVNRTRLHLSWQEDEVLYGLGQSPEGRVNLRGSTQYIHQANMKIAVPFLLSNKNYGLLLATGSPAIFQDTEYGSYLQTEADVQMDFYFIHGTSYAEIIRNYRRLTGKAVMLPKWAFGYMQSQERFETQEELVQVVKEYRERKIGLDCIVLDWFTWIDGHWGQKTFDAERFPDPSAMMEDIHALDARLMISIWPLMNAVTDNYREFKSEKLLFPYSEIYDAIKEEGRELFWKQTERGLFTHGIDAWWCDSSEPFTPEWAMPVKPDPATLYNAYIQETGNFMPLTEGNAYGYYHAQGIYENQRKVTEQKRVTNLTRSGYTGQQKYGTILWSGDISASWDTLQNQIVAGLHLCATGLPYWTLDIGAFFVKRGEPWFWEGNYPEGNADLGYRELYTRWFQYAVFLPVFRAHGTDVRREVWQFGEAGEPFYDALCDSVQLRYSLLPYIYSIAGSVWYEDNTMMRFLTFDFPEDPTVSSIGNQFMFGPALMVCPITKPTLYLGGSTPIENADTTQEIYLPQGCNWYDFWTNESYIGGQWITVDLTITKIPVFVRAGSIVPRTPAVQYVSEKPEAPVTLHVYSGADATFTYYDDDGDGYGYENGEYRLIQFTWKDDVKTLDQVVLHDHEKLQYKMPEFVVHVI